MSRQHSAPILLPVVGESVVLPSLARQGGDESFSEADIQNLVQSHPEVLPIAEVDPAFIGAVAICTELSTPAGPIDNFLVTPSGLPVLVECKLWRNPEGRREVVGQILDYAKELSRWSSSDVKREVRRRLKSEGDPLLEIVQAADPSVDEAAFHDALTTNLRRGRFLLLIVGDGIRKGVEAIAEYLQAHAGLHFSLGLVELPIYRMPDGGHLIAPRVLARTELITRHVVALPDGYALKEELEAQSVAAADADRDALSTEQQRFWAEFLTVLRLDDPEQAIPKPARQGYLAFMLPAPGGSSWLTVYRSMKDGEVGITLSSSRSSPGEYAMERVAADWEAIASEIGGKAGPTIMKDGRVHIHEALRVGALESAAVRAEAFAWLAERVNAFVNVLRPRVRSAAADYRNRGEDAA